VPFFLFPPFFLSLPPSLSSSVWDVRTQTVVRTILTAGAVSSIDIAEDGTTVVTADGTAVQLWSAAADFAPVGELRDANYAPESASLAPGRGRLAAGGGDMWVHVYDATELEEARKLEVNKGALCPFFSSFLFLSPPLSFCGSVVRFNACALA
jgi:WD40 repeat protein